MNIGISISVSGLAAASGPPANALLDESALALLDESGAIMLSE